MDPPIPPSAPSKATKSNSKPTPTPQPLLRPVLSTKTTYLLILLLILALPNATFANTTTTSFPTNTTLPHHHGPTPMHPPSKRHLLCPDHPSEPWKPDCPPSEQHISCPDPTCPDHHHCPDPPRCPEHSHTCPDDGSYHPPYPGDPDPPRHPEPPRPEEPHYHPCAASSEGLYNCMRTTWQRCASGRWSERMSMAAGTVCAPEGLVWSMRTEREGGRGEGGRGGNEFWGPVGPGVRAAGAREGGVLGMGERRVGWEVVGGLVGVVVGTVVIAGGLF